MIDWMIEILGCTNASDLARTEHQTLSVLFQVDSSLICLRQLWVVLTWDAVFGGNQAHE